MTHIDSISHLGELISGERKRQGLTQSDLAGLSGVGITFISNLENGKSTSEVGKVVDVLTTLGIDLFAKGRDNE